MQRITIDDRYDLSERLGSGGMAEVYLAHDGILDRDVALKVLKERYTEDEEFVERFRREARSAAALSHPNIVPVYDRGESDGSEPEKDPGAHYIAMEYVPGGTLKDYMESKGAIESGKAAAVGAQIASALEAAHEQGVVHRDIKPQNVLVTDTGDVKVADFGIARAASTVEASQEISRTSLIMGTANYMAPEQALGEDVTPQSDLYSLGATLYEMLTRELPFTGESPVAVSKKHVGEPPRPPAEVDPGIPEAMSALVMKLLSKAPADRYGSAAKTTDALRLVGDGLPAAIPSSTTAAGATDEATDEPGKVFTDSLAPTAAPARAVPACAFRARAVRPRSRKLIPLFIALTLLGTVISLGFLWKPDEGGVIGSLEDIPGAGAVSEAPSSLGEAAQASLGPEEAEIPNVEGLAEEEARERLDAAGFGVETRSRASSEEDAGLVLEQSVPARREAREGSRVLLAVGSVPQAAQQIAIPDLAGLGYAGATDTLREVGLIVGGRYETLSETAPAGAVIEQGIAPGETVSPGTAVNLTVSSGSGTAAGPTGSSGGASVQDSALDDPGGGAGAADGSEDGWDARAGTLPEEPGASIPPPVEPGLPDSGSAYEPSGGGPGDGSTGEQYE